MATKQQEKQAKHTQKLVQAADNVIAFPPMSPGKHSSVPDDRPGFSAYEYPVKLPKELDRNLHTFAGKLSTGLSPASILLAYTDWLAHLSAYPAKQQELLLDAGRKWRDYAAYSAARLSGQNAACCMEPEEQDNRFDDTRWEALPFALYSQGFLLAQDWWQNATQHIRGVSEHHSAMVQFLTRQWLDMLSPSNNLFTNPEVLDQTVKENGRNLQRGLEHWQEDMERLMENRLPRGAEAYELGTDLATAEGTVVYRNHLFELIQYTPQTPRVHPEPILLIPAWIMKYYILDLSPDNSMVRYLVEQGHTVFMISWKNPGREDASLSMEDYLKDGALRAIDLATEITGQPVHATGYCIGGTLLAIAAAYLAQEQRGDHLKTVNFFTTQLDFREAGELLLFIDDSQLAYLEDLMWQQGYLEKWQLSGAFNMLRSKDLIWSRAVREYLLGENEQMFDLMAWNADATRLPARMHSDYLRQLYLNNDLANHRYYVGGTPIYLEHITQPVFSVATEKDHIAPWPSAFKMHELFDTELTFVLTNGGHNAGVVSEPGHKGRRYRVQTRQTQNGYLSAEQWKQEAKEQDGSWWPEWQQWLKARSSHKAAPPEMGGGIYPPLEDAPGKYVHIR